MQRLVSVLLVILVSCVQCVHIENVLVLGAGGLIGSKVSLELESQGYSVVPVFNRTHVDLRNSSAFLEYVSDFTIDFVFFLACEVGGSKFLEDSNPNIQRSIIEHNVAMYQTILPWASQNQIPLLFTSSSHQGRETAYGSIKRLGELWVESTIGKSVRLWNVFGYERIGLKSRVVSDWISQCLSRGYLTSLTSGEEVRQFTYVYDTARALVAMMKIYDSLDQTTDLAPNSWTQMRNLGDRIAQLSPVPCRANYSEAVSAELLIPETPHPNHVFPSSIDWNYQWSIDSAIEHLYTEYSALFL